MSAALEQELATIRSRVVQIRGLPAATGVTTTFVSMSQWETHVAQEEKDPTIVESEHRDDALFKLLGLMPQSDSLSQIVEHLVNTGAIGEYLPDKKKILVVHPDQGFNLIDQTTYAHEYTHALQDASFSLAKLTDAVAQEDDSSLALSSLIEGDAVLTQSLYTQQYIDVTKLQAEAKGPVATAQAAEQGLPKIVVDSFDFPYTTGVQFVAYLYAQGGYPAINHAFANPPVSTEQIIHPSKYLSHDEPMSVVAPQKSFGEGFKTEFTGQLGEFFLGEWLQTFGVSTKAAGNASAGWGGDAMAIGKNAQGQEELAGRVKWDAGAQGAGRFRDTLNKALGSSSQFTAIAATSTSARFWRGPDGVLAIGSGAGSCGQEFQFAVAPTLSEAENVLSGVCTASSAPNS